MVVHSLNFLSFVAPSYVACWGEMFIWTFILDQLQTEFWNLAGSAC